MRLTPVEYACSRRLCASPDTEFVLLSPTRLPGSALSRGDALTSVSAGRGARKSVTHLDLAEAHQAKSTLLFDRGRLEGIEMMSEDVDVVIEQSHRAWAEFVNGNPEPAKEMFSHKEDVTLANPFGPPVRGWEQAAAAMERAASLYRDGEVVGFDVIAKNTTPDLAYVVELERYKAKIDGSDEVSEVSLRVTSILRPEDGGWKIVHRHADPITTVREPHSVIQE